MAMGNTLRSIAYQIAGWDPEEPISYLTPTLLKFGRLLNGGPDYTNLNGASMFLEAGTLQNSHERLGLAVGPRMKLSKIGGAA